MKQFFQSLISWWFATMTPVHAPTKTLAEREDMRKRRLLSTILFVALVMSLGYVAYVSTTSIAQQILVCWINVIFILLALWLNRQGYLKLACVIFFFINGLTAIIGAQMASLNDPLILLWTCFLVTIFLTGIGLFVPPWMVILNAVIENILLFWYLYIVCYTQITRLLSPLAFQHALLYLCTLIYSSAMMGIFYAITTKRAVTQADRASELEQINRDLTEAHATIQKQAFTDGLTGLPNHRAVMEQLQKELERAQRYERPFSLLFFDADRFKHVNDTYGHAAGDAVLRQIGERAGSALRSGDILGRFGGEEFVILLPEADASEARVVAERIRASVSSGAMAMSEVEGGIVMTVSIGLATCPTDGILEQELLSQADGAMYVAKRLGRNQVRTAEEARLMNADLEMLTLLQQQEQRETAERDNGQIQHAYGLKNTATAIAEAV